MESYEVAKQLVFIVGKEEAGLIVMNGLINHLSDEMYDRKEDISSVI